MKCPKCQYISFESGDRCRNCGYDFSLALDLPPSDLAIKDESAPLGPLAGFTLNDTPNLPLFVKDTGRDPDAPLVTPSAVPRPPLSVRRSSPTPRARREPPRPRPDRVEEPRLALDTAEIPIAVRSHVSQPASATGQAAAAAPATAGFALPPASAGARIVGGAIDLLLIVAVDLSVVYFTLKICDLTPLQAFALPLAPLLAFLAVLNGGYLATFVAAGGQTIGKMAAGTRVVPGDPAAPLAERVGFGQALVRAAAYLLSALPLGLGFVPALFGKERRALHDRLADTRVVKA